MAKRGRKSKSEMAAASVSRVTALPERPSPPPSLSNRESARWVEIMASYDAGHWRATDLTLIENLVRTETYLAECEATIARDGQIEIDRLGGRKEHPAVATRDRHLKSIVTIQRALRLCPSTRVRAESSSLRQKAKSSTPWAK